MAEEGKPKQQGPPYPKKQPLTKAERRALQEAQRAKKGIVTQSAPRKQQQQQQQGSKKKGTQSAKRQKEVELFSHLRQYSKASSAALTSLPHMENIHPEVVKLGLKYANWSIRGSNARAVALLTVLTEVIRDYETPAGKSFHRDFPVELNPNIQYLVHCRPLSVSMGNAIKFLKSKIHKTAEMAEEDAKKFVLEEIENFIQERIIAADAFIVEKGNSKIVDGDVVLTFGASTSVEMIFKAAHDSGKKFRVVIVDSCPHLEGRSLLRRLATYGLECCYVMFNAVSVIMTEVSKVFLGAYSMLSNGNVQSRVGTAAVAMMANRFHIPVLICCETYKFSERAQLDAICVNELTNPDQLVSGRPDVLNNWREVDNLKLLNLTLDLTPAEFVTLVITEIGMIPPTSVPVILREQNTIEGSS